MIVNANGTLSYEVGAAFQGLCGKVGGVQALGKSAHGMSTEIWWSPAYPFKSSLTGQTARQLAGCATRLLYETARLTPEDVADTVLYLASDESRWTVGTEIIVDGGRAL